MTYRRRASPLHAARAAVACLWCAALVVAALAAEHPATLAGALAAALAGALLAGVGREVLRFTLLLGLPLALLIAVGNALISREGLTVVARLGELPPLGQLDITLEALGFGAILGLRAMAVIACCALYFSAVDPDEVLRLFRRFGFRSALTATLATRMVGVLAADGRRMADGQRCRPGPPASRLALVRAVTAGALDRATDVAAALEVRGYGSARRPARQRRPWSRHDLAFLASAIAVLALTVLGAAAGTAEVHDRATLELTGGAGPWALAGALLAVAVAPLLDRRGIAR
ncbi:MAG TPA: energy-coupling factor transporter transmembrane component T [Capillimicrobium sp.]|jgi:energy-coupling factor transport system permease protein